MESFEYIREEVHALMNEFFKSVKQSITLKDNLSIQGGNIISRMMLGKRYMDKSENNIVSPEELREMMVELLFLNGILNIGDYIPWTSFLDLQVYIKRFDRLMEHVLEEHIERREGKKDYVAKDMMDVLLDLADDPTLEVKLGKIRIKALTQDLLAAGTETSSVGLEWAICELMRKTEVLKKATEELQRVIGKERWVEEEDIVNLPHIHALVKESMRLHPLSPLLVPRLALEDINIHGYDIPKGAHVQVNIWAIGRDPIIWDNPNIFIPERLLGKDIEITGNDFELLLFGAGRRMCPGYPLGIKVTLGTLANMLHGFNWNLPYNTKIEDMSMEETLKLSMPKKLPLEVVVEPRLPNHLFEF